MTASTLIEIADQVNPGDIEITAGNKGSVYITAGPNGEICASDRMTEWKELIQTVLGKTDLASFDGVILKFKLGSSTGVGLSQLTEEMNAQLAGDDKTFRITSITPRHSIVEINDVWEASFETEVLLRDVELVDLVKE